MLRQVYCADQLAQFGAPQGLTRLITLETFSKLIVEVGGYQQRAKIPERGSSRELYPIRHRKRDILAKRKDVSRRFSHWLPSKSTLTKANTVKLTKNPPMIRSRENGRRPACHFKGGGYVLISIS